MNKLPMELQILIIEYLDTTQDIENILSVNKQWYLLKDDPVVIKWYTHCKLKYDYFPGTGRLYLVAKEHFENLKKYWR
jgi:hypothetical protein